jgi:hypothetical protein
MLKKICMLLSLLLVSVTLTALSNVNERFQDTQLIVYPKNGERVDSTVAAELKASLAQSAELRSVTDGKPFGQGIFTVSVYDEGLAIGPDSTPVDSEWCYVRLKEDGSGELVASKKHLLYGLYARLRDDAGMFALSKLSQGILITSPFRVIIGEDGFYGRRRRFSRGYNAEQTIRELARMGCSHVVANALALPYPVEEGPKGEVYYRFYQYAPDLDMYVETRLNEGTYPPEVLKANMNFLKEQARLADSYGLTPGMYMANPRSMPESFWQKFPWLRGARVDHTFRAFRPRYNLTVVHPLARWHYAEMLTKVLKAVPELGFMVTLINDSGSGFEYTESLYPGRNGGPYLVREWRPDDVIARKAAENIIRYYHTLRDAAHKMNPDFRIITGLKNIAEEAEIILNGLEKGIDLSARTQRYDAPSQQKRRAELQKRGSNIFTHATAKGSPYIKGIPSPWKTCENLQQQINQQARHINVDVEPGSLVPWDINREIVTAVQFNHLQQPDSFISSVARRWVGPELGDTLVSIWKQVDRVNQSVPDMGLYAASGFTWYRIWDRPLVPDIARIPEKKRAYYEDYLLAVFNNPNRIDLQADALWDLYTLEQCEKNVEIYDTEVWAGLDSAIEKTALITASLEQGQKALPIFSDLRDRLKAWRCYLMTLRNTCAWISGVHGYLNASTAADRTRKEEMLQEMIELELSNTRDLLKLWRQTDVEFMPIYRYGENGHDYGPNFDDCLEKKIALMQKYADVTPNIDPDYMWRLPRKSGLDISPDEYLKY